MTARAFLTTLPPVVGAATLGLVSLGVLLFAGRSLLRFAAPLLGETWIPTASIALQCAALMAVGWLIGRWGWSAVVVVAGAIALRRFSDLLWLVRLFVDCFQNQRYLPFFLNSLGIHVLLLASLFLGANWSRQRDPAALRIK